MTSIIKYLVTVIVAFTANQLSAQTFQSKVLDQKTNEPIPFATIQYGEHRGVISNEDGVFNFTLRKKAKATDSVHLSSMGYENKSFSLQNQLNSVIYLGAKRLLSYEVFSCLVTL